MVQNCKKKKNKNLQLIKKHFFFHLLFFCPLWISLPFLSNLEQAYLISIIKNTEKLSKNICIFLRKISPETTEDFDRNFSIFSGVISLNSPKKKFIACLMIRVICWHDNLYRFRKLLTTAAIYSRSSKICEISCWTGYH